MDHEAKIELKSIVDGLSTEDRAFIAGLPEDGVVFHLHFGLGTYIRNQIRQGEFPALFRWSQTQLPELIGDLDDLTEPILLEIWRLVQESSDGRR